MTTRSEKPVVFLTGKNGQVGYELNATLASIAQVLAVDVDELDLTDEDAIRRTIRDVRPDLIVNPAEFPTAPMFVTGIGAMLSVAVSTNYLNSLRYRK